MDEKKKSPQTSSEPSSPAARFDEFMRTIDPTPQILKNNERMAEAFVRNGSKRTKEEILADLNRHLVKKA